MAVSEVRGSGPLFAWPGARNLKLTLPLCWLFLKIFTSVYGGASLLAGLRGELPHLYFAFELDLPFIPAMAAVYLTGPLVLAAAPFVLRTWRDITPLARNEWICWMESAKKQETRRKRIDWGRSSLRDGKRRPCCWPGCPHR